MAIDTVPSGPILGMDNRRPADQLETKEGAYAASIVNGDMTNVGTVSRRKGSVMSLAGSRCHSLWGDGLSAFVVDENTMYQLSNRTGSLQRTAIASVTPGLQFSYARAPLAYFASNGKEALRISMDGSVAPWALPVPSWQPEVSVDTTGALPAGKYMVTIAFASSATGEEGCADLPLAVDVPQNGAITLNNLPQLAGHYTAIYITPVNGDLPQWVGGTSGTTFRYAVDAAFGVHSDATLLAPMPPGHIVRHGLGRLLVATGHLLLYSEPHNLGVYNPGKNYIWFPEPVNMIEPCEKGTYVSADRTYWLAGNIAQADLTPVLPYRALLGASGAIPDEKQVWWMSERGVVVGDDGGVAVNVQAEHTVVPAATIGASLFREQNGIKQMISTMFNPQRTAMTADAYMEAEVIRKETVL